MMNILFCYIFDYPYEHKNEKIMLSILDNS